MLSFIRAANIDMREVRAKSMGDSQALLVAMVVQGLKYDAQKAFVSYVRSVALAANKAVFDVDSIDLEKFAASLGLPRAPPKESLGLNVRRNKSVSYADQPAVPAGTMVSRRERHLKASDMARTAVVMQRFSAVDDVDGDLDDVLRRRPEAQVVEPLTYDERIAGMSKAKRRRIVEAGDVRVADLNLSTHHKFVDESDNESTGADDPNEALRLRLKEAIATSEDLDDESGAIVESMKQQLSVVKAEDTQRAKDLRKQRRRRKTEGSTVTGGAVLADPEKSSSDEGSEVDDSDLRHLISEVPAEVMRVASRKRLRNSAQQ